MNKKLALFLTCCAISGLTACNERVEWGPQVLECTNDSMMCQDGNVNKCENGKWVITARCLGTATPYCDSTTYTCSANIPAACPEGNKLCEGDALKMCVSGTWVLYNCAPGTCDASQLTCSGGQEIPTPNICNPGCNGSDLTTCKDGVATKTTCSGDTPICDPYAANGPACAKAGEVKDCLEGAKKCESVNDVPTAFVCGSDGKWDNGTACDDGQICSNNECANELPTSGCEYTNSSSEKQNLKDGDVICDGTLRVTCTGTDVTTYDCSDEGIDITCSTASGSAICASPAGCAVDGSEELAKHGDKMCKESEIVVCDDGRWVTDKNCANDESGKTACQDAQCVACLADDKKCEFKEGVHTLYTCENNEWKDTACGDGLVCDTANPSTSCVDPISLMDCSKVDGGNGSYCQDIHDQNYSVFCVSGEVNTEYTENCTKSEMICDYTSNMPECIEIPDGCKTEDACNDDTIKDITCGNHFNDMYASGEVKCDILCTEVDYSACLYCGDGKVTADPNGEQCDGDNIGEATCKDVEGLDKEKNYTGTPGCENCMLTVGTCVESGGEAPTSYTTIKQIRDDYDNIKAKQGLESIDIKGVVTWVSATAFTLQDPDGSENIAGMYVYCGENDKGCPDFPTAGQYVNVKFAGALTVFKDLIEISGNKETLTIETLEGDVKATAVTKTIADITANEAKNAYMSMIVTLENMEVTDPGSNAKLKNGENSIAVTNAMGGNDLVASLKSDFIYNVVGIVHYNTTVKNSIGPRTTADLTITGCKDTSKVFNGDQANPACETQGGGGNKSCKGLDDEMIAHDAIGCMDESSYSICVNGEFSQDLKTTCPKSKSLCNKNGKTDEERCVACLSDSHCAGDDELHVVGICVSNVCDIKCASTYAYDKGGECNNLAAKFVSIDEGGKAYAQINQLIFPDNTIKSPTFLCTTDKTKAISDWTKLATTVNTGYDNGGGNNVEYTADLTSLKGDNFCTFTFVVDDVTYIAEKAPNDKWAPIAASASYKFAQDANLWTYKGAEGGEDKWVTIVEAPEKYIGGEKVVEADNEECKKIDEEKSTRASCNNTSSNVGTTVPKNGECVKPTNTNWTCDLSDASNPAAIGMTNASVNTSGYLSVSASWAKTEDFTSKYVKLTLSDAQIAALAGKTKIRARFNCKQNKNTSPENLAVAFFNGDTKLGNSKVNTITTDVAECMSEEIELSSTASLNLRITAYAESSSAAVLIYPITIEAK